MFSGSLFIGASLGTTLARPHFAARHVSALFGLGAVLAVGVTAASLLARRASLR
jgi:hypothetical protein